MDLMATLWMISPPLERVCLRRLSSFHLPLLQSWNFKAEWVYQDGTLQWSCIAYAPRCVIDNSDWYNIRRLEYSFSPQYLLNWERCFPNTICWGGWLSTFTSRSNFLSPLDRNKLIIIKQVLAWNAWQLCRISRQSVMDLLLKDTWCDPTVMISTR